MSLEFDTKVSDLVKQKGFYPYEYLPSLDKFNETLPSRNKFYSPLSGKGIGDKKYQHVLKVWIKFEMKTKKQCHDLYLKCDILLIAYMFEK